MRLLSLHVKTTFLASIVILLVMAATLGLFSSRVLGRFQVEQKNLAQLQAETLADHISNSRTIHEYQQIALLIELMRNSSQEQSGYDIRIWERSGNVFIKRVTGARDAANQSNEELSDDIKTALRSGQEVQYAEDSIANYNFRVLVPIFEDDRVSGAVEVVEKLDTTWTLVWRYVLTEIWLAISSVLFLSLAIYVLFRSFVYRPLDDLALAMQRVKMGELDVRLPINSGDEFGEIAVEFNRMLTQIGEMTREREFQKDVLREQVQIATSEVTTRNLELEQASRELWQTARKISELERLAAAGQTAAQFAHEVGTPLNLISGHVQLLHMSFKDNSAALNRLDTITTQIERIERIVRKMMDRTRFGEIEFEALDLNTLLHKIFAVTAPTLDEKKVTLIPQLADDLPRVDGNSDRLQQVFINLFNNALDAMPGGGELRVVTKLSEDKVCIEVADTGLGMSEETKARIFEPLYTTKQRGHGTGLGLVVVRQILHEHNADIAVESNPGAGTKFILSFPIKHKFN